MRITGAREDIDYVLSISMLEVYNERVYDLLAPPPPAGKDDDTDCVTKRPECKIAISRTDGSTYVDGLVARDVQTAADVAAAMSDGEQNRSVSTTMMNTASSRSHLLVVISVNGTNKINGSVSAGKLTLVDLAGSERM